MIGQEKLIEKLYKIQNLDDFPKSIIIVGNEGMGKHTFVNEISSHLFMNGFVEEIDYELTLDIINDMHALTIPRLYVINFNDIAKHKRIDRFQNTILKFIEEPPMFAWIIILSDKIDSIYETIKNRCQIWHLSQYNVHELNLVASENKKEFSDEELKILSSPGNIIKYDKEYLNRLMSLSDNILNSISIATPSNVLSLDKYFFSEEHFDLELFIKVFKYISFKKYFNHRYDNNFYNAVIEAGKFENKLNVIGVNKQYLFENFILRLKKCMK